MWPRFTILPRRFCNGDAPVDCDVIVCSDDADATATVRELAAKIPGVRAIDGGKLENARILEQITALLIGLNIRHKGHSGIRITGLPEKAYEVIGFRSAGVPPAVVRASCPRISVN